MDRSVPQLDRQSWPRLRSLCRFADPLLAVVVALNLLWPTSAPLRANGIPINTWAEYALVSLFLGWLGLLLSFAILRKIDLAVAPAHRFTRIDRFLTTSALVLGLSLLLVRMLTPIGESVTACYSTPERPEVPCLFLADGWTLTTAARNPQLSRQEERIWFDPERGFPWRLGAFNDQAFNIYGSLAPDRRSARREIFRRHAAHPFSVTFAWDSTTSVRLARLYPLGAQIRIDYRGEATLATDERIQLLPLHRNGRPLKKVIDLRPDELRSLRLHFQNFSCPDHTCLSELTMDPVPLASAVFRVSLGQPGVPADQLQPLDRHLLSLAEPMLSPTRLARPIELVFILIGLARLVTWIVRLSVARRPTRRLILVTGLLACVLAVLLALKAGKTWTLPLLLSFVLMTLPVMLASGGVLMAVIQRRRAAVEMLAPLLLVLASTGLLMQGPSTLATVAREAPPSAIAQIAKATRSVDEFALPLRDDSILYKPGSDPRTYAGWAMDLLHSPRRFTHRTVVLSKPFFSIFEPYAMPCSVMARTIRSRCPRQSSPGSLRSLEFSPSLPLAPCVSRGAR